MKWLIASGISVGGLASSIVANAAMVFNVNTDDLYHVWPVIVGVISAIVYIISQYQNRREKEIRRQEQEDARYEALRKEIQDWHQCESCKHNFTPKGK